MSTTTNSKNASNATNPASKKEEKTMEPKVDTQTGKTTGTTQTVLRNTDWTAFQKMTDKFLDDYKGDSQELEMIVSMMPVMDVLSSDNIVHLIKGDKQLYTPKPRKNAAKGKLPKVTAANQQRGALLELLPHYEALMTAADNEVLNAKSEMAKAQKRIEKESNRNLSNKEIVALFKTTEKNTVNTNVKKGEATLKIEALEAMFDRAIRKVYYLRRIRAESVKLNAKQKTITYIGAVASTEDGKVHITEALSSYTVTLAELSKASNSVLMGDKVTVTRGVGQGASNTTPSATPSTSTAQINPIDTAQNNSRVLATMVESIIKDKKPERLAAFKKAEAPKKLFDDMLQALFISDKQIDIAALQTAIDRAMTKGKVGRKVFVHYASEIPANEDPNAIADAAKANNEKQTA